MKHEFKASLKDEWLTPPDIIKNLGEFDLDPCSPVNRPWDTAKNHFTIKDNGLLCEWNGRVWLNPPYGKNIDAWMNKMCLNDNGIALVFARTETTWFFNYVWSIANGILFIKKRLQFHNVDGTLGNNNAGAPSVLISYGNNNDSLEESGIPGKFIDLNFHVVFILFDYSNDTWKIIVNKALEKLNGKSRLDTIYDMVIKIAPKKVSNNTHFKEKIRQTLQMYFKSKKRGLWQN